MFLLHSATLIKHNMLHIHFFGTLILNFLHKQFPQRLFRTLELCSFCLIAVLHFNPLFNTCFISLCWRNYFFWFYGCYWENHCPFNCCYLVFSFSFFLIAFDIFFLSLVSCRYIQMCLGVDFFIFILFWGCCASKIWTFLSFIAAGRFSDITSFNIASFPFYAFFFLSPNWCMLDLLVVASMPLKFTLRFF